MYKILKTFDNYKIGDKMQAADVADQKRRGNLPDLIANGYVVEIKRKRKPPMRKKAAA